MKHNWSMMSLSSHAHIRLTPEEKDAVGKSAEPGGVPHTCEVPSFYITNLSLSTKLVDHSFNFCIS